MLLLVLLHMMPSAHASRLPHSVLPVHLWGCKSHGGEMHACMHKFMVGLMKYSLAMRCLCTLQAGNADEECECQGV